MQKLVKIFPFLVWLRLTTFETIKADFIAGLTGAIIVTTPQDLAHQDVKKGSDMFSKVNTPVLGVIENMSFYNLRGRINGYDKGSIDLSIDSIY